MQKVVVMEKLIGIRPTERELLEWSKSALKKPRPTDESTVTKEPVVVIMISEDNLS